MEILAGAGSFVATTSTDWQEHLTVPDLSVGTYSLPAGGTDPQSPHTEDEIYVVTRGRATLWTPDRSALLVPGDVAFVPAGEEHRFVDIVEDFAVLVVFGPAEYSRAVDQARVNPAIDS
jgi:quercetin dioxygenase-like cupin family protein